MTPVTHIGDDDMSTLMDKVAEQNGGRLLSAGASAHEHFVQFSKILDLAYEADRKMVSLVESLGVRETTAGAKAGGL
jgi:hypothetical protein